jgi:nitrogen regulatory protein PII 1
LLLLVVPDKDKDMVLELIIRTARSGQKGSYGDGKIFVSPVEEVYTVSSGVKESDAAAGAGVKP